MDLSDSSPMIPPAVRITVLLRLVSEGFQDAFGTGPAWLELPAADLTALRQAVGDDRVEQLTSTIGLREGDEYRAGGAAGTVSLSDAAHSGVLGLMGLAAIPADVLVEETDGVARYKVPDDWFIAQPAAGGS
jgi:hypothetical protein